MKIFKTYWSVAKWTNSYCAVGSCAFIGCYAAMRHVMSIMECLNCIWTSSCGKIHSEFRGQWFIITYHTNLSPRVRDVLISFAWRGLHTDTLHTKIHYPWLVVFLSWLNLQCFSNHYIDVIMTMMACQIISLTVVHSTFYSDADQRKHQSSPSLAFVWGIHRDRWIPRTKGQLRGKCFHLMTSSWYIQCCNGTMPCVCFRKTRLKLADCYSNVKTSGNARINRD